jgi:crotonobetainyl-CoA:carnitine CoA-transferase CaiB-like acyl-CoA transferase
MRQLLSDFHVVELSQEPAGEYCGKVFADLGAEVVKVESPSGDPQRADPARFAHLNTNKKSRPLDALWWLIEQTDLVIESPDQGDLEALGTRRDDLRKRRPGAVVVSITGFGTSGPYAGYKWSDLVAHTVAGATWVYGGADAIPVKLPSVVGGPTGRNGGLPRFAGRWDCGWSAAGQRPARK